MTPPDPDKAARLDAVIAIGAAVVVLYLVFITFMEVLTCYG